MQQEAQPQTHSSAKGRRLSEFRSLSIKQIDVIERQTGAAAFDIGGTLIKCVYWSPQQHSSMPPFISKDSFRGKPLKLLPNPDLALYLDKSQVKLNFVKFPTMYANTFFNYVKEANVEKKFGYKEGSSVTCTGGGAYKYSNTIKTLFGMNINIVDEMKSIASGVDFLLRTATSEVFSWEKKDGKSQAEKVFLEHPEEIEYPYFIVNVGSGISILKVEGPDKFSRVSGTAIGGGTFLGLSLLLSKIESFEQIMDCCKKGGIGDNKTVDLLVSDIIGTDSFNTGNLIASSFGKFQREIQEDYKNEDIIKSLQFMVTDNFTQIAFLTAQLHKVTKIFFTGMFVMENVLSWNTISYGINFWSKGKMKAYYLLHDGYLGALGALLDSTPKK